MKFAKLIELLRSTSDDAYVLCGRHGQPMVIVTPRLAGRVMATSFDGENGDVNCFIDEEAFRTGMRDIWDNWGGEERYWLAPEGGQLGLMFQGKENCFANYFVQPSINSQKYRVTEFQEGRNSITMEANFDLRNAADTLFSVQCKRRITALDECPYAVGTDVETVGFESASTIVNVGSNAWRRETGALAHWHLGQFLPGQRVIVVIPFRQGTIYDPPIREDYFREFCIGGKMPSNRYWIRDCFALFKADGKCRTKIGQNRSRATGLIASCNLDTNELILLDYDFYPNLEYVSSYWYYQADPYAGDCISFSAEGPSEIGGPDGRCYELEALSPAMFLMPDQCFTFRTRTMHVRGRKSEIAGICRRHLGVEYSTLEEFSRNS